MTERTTVVSLDCYAGFERLPQAIAELHKYGCTFERYTSPTGIVECWRFYGCKNVPDILPAGWSVWAENSEWSEVDGWAAVVKAPADRPAQ